MSAFPKEKQKSRGKLNSFTCKSIKIPVWCYCRMPECIDDMIYCDNRKCKTWFHRKCVGLGSTANEWRCPSCEQQHV